ncbi:MAG TPA: D-glycero-beta-D-manno-heptose-7-phosphate kinase [Solirubrobacteraceae bacterium]|nr:D-glycero-beta-D-manno-heptose-7-phosphate kinase [Solirubrobacteraceae bacterium]
MTADALTGARVLVVGDLMLDEYVWGNVRRISPEAPVPVVEITRRTHAPGGAANVAAGVVALGGHAALVGVTGADAAGERLRASLRRADIDVSALISDRTRPTTNKTRFIAHAQQVVRADEEDRRALDDALVTLLLSHVAERLPETDCVVLSDYGKGVVTDAVAHGVITAARDASTPIVVDPKGLRYAKYAGATVITPNDSELAQAAHVQIDSDAELVAAAERMAADCQASLLVTRGAAGMTLVGGAERLDVPAQARDVYDVTGAGDTVVAVLAAALGRGLTLERAVVLANAAAGVAVGKVGAAAITTAELSAALRQADATATE